MTPLVIAIQTSAAASSQLRSLGVPGMVQGFEWNAYSIHILLRKDLSFVSGHRCSEATGSLKSERPFRGGAAKAAHDQNTTRRCKRRAHSIIAIAKMMRRILLMLRRTEITFAAILLFGLLAMTARNAVDPDLWWHLRTGQWIAGTGHVPHSDPFSFTRAGQAWGSHEWLSEVVFYELWKYGGAAALIVFSTIITTAGFMLLYLRCLPHGKNRHWAAAATSFGALVSAPSWGVRPQMFTFALASLLLWLLEAGEHRPRLLLWIPPLFLLWLNLHAGFALGP